MCDVRIHVMFECVCGVMCDFTCVGDGGARGPPPSRGGVYDTHRRKRTQMHTHTFSHVHTLLRPIHAYTHSITHLGTPTGGDERGGTAVRSHTNL